MINKEQKQGLPKLVRESRGDIAGRFDNLDGKTPIIIFETPNELGVYRAETSSPITEIAKLRTETSEEAVPKVIASMSKGAFYNQNMLTVLCSSEMKKGRPIHYYGI